MGEWNNFHLQRIDNTSDELNSLLDKYEDIDYFSEEKYFNNELIPKLNELEESLNDSYYYLNKNQDFFEESYFDLTILEIEKKLESIKVMKNTVNFFMEERNRSINYYDSLYQFT